MLGQLVVASTSAHHQWCRDQQEERRPSSLVRLLSQAQPVAAGRAPRRYLALQACEGLDPWCPAGKQLPAQRLTCRLSWQFSRVAWQLARVFRGPANRSLAAASRFFTASSETIFRVCKQKQVVDHMLSRQRGSRNSKARAGGCCSCMATGMGLQEAQPVPQTRQQGVKVSLAGQQGRLLEPH